MEKELDLIDFKKIKLLDVESVKKLDVEEIFEGIDLKDLQKISNAVVKEWEDKENTIYFRTFCLKLLRHITILNRVDNHPLSGFWKKIANNDNSNFRREAILASTISSDESLIALCCDRCHKEKNKINRCLAFETLGTIIKSNPDKNQKLMRELEKGLEAEDNWSKLGALLGLGIINSNEAFMLIEKFLSTEEDELLISFGYAILAACKPSMAKALFSLIKEKNFPATLSSKLLAVAAYHNPLETKKVMADSLINQENNKSIREGTITLMTSILVNSLNKSFKDSSSDEILNSFNNEIESIKNLIREEEAKSSSN